MGQTRMFRDRVVSMEQTLEGGEKHLPLLTTLCREALPDFELREHALDHERDLFVMDLEGPEGAKKRICWTRMVLYDAERIPTLTQDPAAALRGKIVDFLRANAARLEILVTFRHLEEGWVDTPEPRRDPRRRRRGGRGGRGAERGGPERRPAGPSGRPQQPSRRPGPGPGQGQRQGQGQGQRGPGGPPRGGAPAQLRAANPAVQGQGAGDEGVPGAKRRKRSRRRRRGRGPGGGGPGATAPPAGAGP
jgi:hypothetical protein